MLVEPDQAYYAVLRNRELIWQLEDFTTKVDPDSIMVQFGPEGAMVDVTSSAAISKDGDSFAL